MIKIKIAGLCVGIENRYEYTENLCRDFLSDEEPLFTVRATDAEIEKERSMYDSEFSSGYLESVVVYRNIAERLPLYDAFVFHGAVLRLDGCAYAFTARSGVGKTTHTRFWTNKFDRAEYINGDKPIIRFIDGTPYAFGTPWKGKEGYGSNVYAPLRSIAFIERAEENSAREVGIDEVTVKLISQIYLPRSADTAPLALALADRLLRSVKLIGLKCNLDPSAADVAYSAMRPSDT